jgi:hypothetical protein
MALIRVYGPCKEAAVQVCHIPGEFWLPAVIPRAQNLLSVRSTEGRCWHGRRYGEGDDNKIPLHTCTYGVLPKKLQLWFATFQGNSSHLKSFTRLGSCCF